MRIVNAQLWSAVDFSTNQVTQGFAMPHELNAAIQIVISGASPAGSLKLQASCDPGADTTEIQPTNWTDVAASTVAVSSAGSILYTIQNSGYPWIRVGWTADVGSVALASARINAKGF